MTLVVLALLTLAGAGVLAALTARAPSFSSAVGAGGAVLGCALAATPLVQALAGADLGEFRFAWSLPGGAFTLGCDPLSAFFGLPVLVLGALGAIYGHEYFRVWHGRRSLGIAWLAYGLMVAAMVLVVVARNGLLFLVAWEVMSLAAFVLVTFEHERPEVRRAGWVYLIATHVGTACLVALFVTLQRPAGVGGAGSFDFDALSGAVAPTSLFVLALVGFGVKAGVVPLHVWLPEAHAAAPSHVSALMSGALVNLGLYGLLRTLTLLGPPALWWGPCLVALGLSGAFLGIALALGQRDLKRALAYSTVENLGLALLGLGLGVWGRAAGDAHLAVLGTTAGLLHVWNHSAMKGLMFLSAGSVLHGTGTRDLERLGGLLARMPSTGTLFVVGAAAIAGLPPLNGFVGEWLLMLGLLDRGLETPGFGGLAPLLIVGALSFVGGLAALCFVRLAGIALLGDPRSESSRHAHESSRTMLGPMFLLALTCVVFGVFPELPLGLVSAAVSEVSASSAALAPSVVGLTRLHASLWAAMAVVWLMLAWRTRARTVSTGPTWGCGYVGPVARVQYSARSFSELAVARLIPRVFRPRPACRAPHGLFPAASELTVDASDPVTRGLYEPFLSRQATRFSRLRWLQQGNLNAYLLYVLVAVVVLLAWVTVRSWSDT